MPEKQYSSKTKCTELISDRDVALVAQMGNIAFRTGEKVFWDNAKQSFKTSTANALITPQYQNGWKLPKY
ncbi:MAG: hypothetical protein MZV63_59680 [Marinilabiliales bacterium]|nr:hypothetical protein [Marinilabiliales bacterium]